MLMLVKHLFLIILHQVKQNQEVCIKVDNIDKKVVYKVDFDETYIVSTYMTDEDKKIYTMFKDDIESK